MQSGSPMIPCGGRDMDYDDLGKAYENFTKRVWSHYEELVDERDELRRQRNALGFIIVVALFAALIWPF